MTGTSATVTHLLMESQFFAELKTTISCCEALGFNPLSHPERFSSLPLLIRFGMLRNFFLPSKKATDKWPFSLVLTQRPLNAARYSQSWGVRRF